MKSWSLFVIGLTLVLASCSPTEQTLPEETMSMTLTSLAFTQGNPIPARYTCTSEDISPPLSWDMPPSGTQSLALISR